MAKEPNSLVQRKPDSLTRTQQLLTPCEIVLARELEITAGNAKTALTQTLTREFFRVFACRSPEAIEWAFRTHRDQSDFWPSIRQIGELVAEWDKRKRSEEKSQLEAWTPEGLKQWRDLLKEFCDRMPNMPTGKRYRPAVAVKNSREAIKTQAERLAHR